jgi:hypothetical protein
VSGEVVRTSHLAAAGARWDDDATAGAWIGPRLGPFGPTLGHAVPHGYDAYAVVRLVPDGDEAEGPSSADVVRRVLDVLAPVTGTQPVHCGLWEGWGFLHDPGTDPRTASGMGTALLMAPGATPGERARAEAEAAAVLAAVRVERPAAERLELPHRAYHLWTGPLRAVLALDAAMHDLPSLVWPDDRTWFVGVPIYTRELAIGAPRAVVDALLADPTLAAREAAPSDVLDVDD